MAQPKEPPLSVRLPSEVREAVDDWAKRWGIKRNAAMVALLRVGLAGAPPKPPVGDVEMAAFTKGEVWPEKVKRAAPEPKISRIAGVQLGPAPSMAGSRLKKR